MNQSPASTQPTVTSSDSHQSQCAVTVKQFGSFLSSKGRIKNFVHFSRKSSSSSSERKRKLNSRCFKSNEDKVSLVFDEIEQPENFLSWFKTGDEHRIQRFTVTPDRGAVHPSKVWMETRLRSSMYMKIKPRDSKVQIKESRAEQTRRV